MHITGTAVRQAS